MGVAKLQAVKDTTTFLVQQMSSQDRLGVVSFDDQVSCSASLPVAWLPAAVKSMSLSAVFDD